MKHISVFVVLCVILCSLVFTFSGCGSTGQPGETQAEVHRRHIRNERINKENLNKDVDTFLLTDEPSKLSDKKIP